MADSDSGKYALLDQLAEEFAAQIGNRGEDAAVNDFSLESGKPDFDLIQPGAIGGGEMEFHVRMAVQE